jgi:twitching motility protein PilT
MAMEILIPNKAIRNLIREDKLHQIYSSMQSGQEDSGMQTMNRALMSLIDKRLITLDQAVETSPEPEELEEMISKRDQRGVGAQAKGKFIPKKGA